jgi:hypothetical protein
LQRRERQVDINDIKLSKMQVEMLAKQLKAKLEASKNPPYGISVESVSSIYLDVGTKLGGKLSNASGALLRLGGGPIFLVTNRHVVTGLHQETNKTLSKFGAVPDQILAWVPAEDPANGMMFYGIELSLLDEDSNPLWIEHPTLGAKADIVALPLHSLSAPPEQIQRFTYDLTKPRVAFLGPGDIISVVGFPFGKSVDNTAIWATGFIATEVGADFENLPVMLVDCRSREGQSGSPVIFSRQNAIVPTGQNSSAMYSGRVTDFLGIYSGRINSESDLGRVWKASAIAELLKAAEAIASGE